MKINDIVIFKDIHYQQAKTKIKNDYPPISAKIEIAKDVFIEIIDSDLATEIFLNCTPNGSSDEAADQRQLYSFVRENAPTQPFFKWDNDENLQICIALSRLIQPTTISFEYSARVVYLNGRVHEIIPGPVSNFGAHAWVATEESRNWLTEIEGEELSELFNKYKNSNLPTRIRQASWYLEYIFRSYHLDIRWPLLCTALESLIHTDKYKSTRQFSKRVSRLANEVGIQNFDETKAEQAYDYRSRLVHGQLLRDLKEYDAELYIGMEEILRKVLKLSIISNSFAKVFSSEASIKKRWPIK